MSTPVFENPSRDCPLCPRLNAFIAENRAAHPDWWNAPVPSFGPLDAPILILGLAPGLQGANRTGRPFTGDWAGDLLYKVLVEEGLAEGVYDRRPDDGLRLTGCRIANAVRCVPPQNKPIGQEMNACRPFLVDEIAAMTNLKTVFTLGRIAHEAILRVLGQRPAGYKFAHEAVHRVEDKTSREIFVVNSYHCSRYNTNTGRLTEDMFRQAVRAAIKAAGSA
ncbi:uracil-DNA glycosylase [Pacificispira spongiicola]|uniref:uracil-DNA glycosylase n=1 Tax=Pacificispira spongiicola TaxID=2729598 RepID=UPI0029CA405F|nr:uracil-DNA glycosylase [Pacificispira spongiicola]